MKYSIHTKITISFIVIFFIVCFCFIISMNLEVKDRYEFVNYKQENFLEGVMNSFSKGTLSNLQAYLEHNEYVNISEEEFQKALKGNENEVRNIKTDFGNFVLFAFNDRIYLHFKNGEVSFCMKSDKTRVDFEFIFFGFLLCILLMAFLYFNIINSLSPLSQLKKEISKAFYSQTFSSENYANDEIGAIAKEFSNMIHQNHALVESRQVFLRAMMHELKTPLGKARIITEMLNDTKNKARLISIFQRMDCLINEFAKVENVLSKSYTLNIQICSFMKIIKLAESFLMIDDFDKKVHIEVKEAGVYEVDVEVFALMLKNLIDNALKYSTDKKCCIYSYKDYFMVKNKGEPLKYDYHEYLKAFYRGNNEKTQGMGLGLYIVNKICNIHHYTLKYEYKDGFHSFSVHKDKANA